MNTSSLQRPISIRKNIVILQAATEAASGTISMFLPHASRFRMSTNRSNYFHS